MTFFEKADRNFIAVDTRYFNGELFQIYERPHHTVKYVAKVNGKVIYGLTIPALLQNIR